MSHTRYDDLLAKLVAASRPERHAGPDYEPYLAKVRDRAYTVTDADVQALKDAGYTEDEIFEHTVSAAVDAGLLRLDAGLRALP